VRGAGQARYTDHTEVEGQLARRWAGADVELSRPLPSDLAVAAAQIAPDMMRTVGPYLIVQALPASLSVVEPRAHALFAGGWRPPEPVGPTCDGLAAIVTRAAGRTG